jgi:hypothetical protein
MDQVTRLPDGTFRPGFSGNPRGPLSRKARRDARMNDLAAEFGGIDALSPGDRRFLTEAVDLLLSITKTTNENNKVRVVNAVNRIVSGIRERRASKRAPSDPWLVELIDHEDRSQTNAVAPAGGGDDHAGEPASGHGEAVPEEESFERRVERARIGDIVRVGDVEIEIVADDDDEAAL